MRRTALLLASIALAVLLASGVALAANIRCDGGESCVGTNRSDVIRGDGKANFMYGRGGGDTLKGFGARDQLFGDDGEDRLLGGARSDALFGGLGDDTLKGGDSADAYFYKQKSWGKDTITDPTTNNFLSLFLLPSSAGPLTTRLTSDTVLPEVTDATGTNTVNWDGNVVRDVDGHRGDDTITGNDDSNEITDGSSAPDPAFDIADTDNITGAGGDDLIDVRDGEGDDTVDCGGGTDTVRFDQGDRLVIPGDCERKNPQQQ